MKSLIPAQVTAVYSKSKTMSIGDSPGFVDHNMQFARPSIVEALGNFADNYDLSTDDYIVIGGASLVVMGILDVTPDIDLLVPEKIWGRLYEFGKAKGRVLTIPSDEAIFRGAENNGIAFPSSAYRVPISATVEMGDGFYPISFDSQIDKSVIINGIPLQGLDETINSKSTLRRPRDVSHLRTIQQETGISFPIPCARPIVYKAA